MGDGFAVRGVVEGFYGPPWSEAARLDLIRFLADQNGNAYVYAPKEDPFHRSRWREPYGAAMRAHFGAIAQVANERGVRFGWAISPGLDIDYESAADRASLLKKIVPLLDLGVSWIMLTLDDIPMQPNLAPRQAALTTWLLDALGEQHDHVDLTLCPTEYVGMRATPYLEALDAGLPSDVDVLWTGPTVCSPTISAQQAREWKTAIGDRTTLIWDNYPVNDGPMETSVHLGAYVGRDPELVDVVSGVLCNPMALPYSSKVALGSALRFMHDPRGYEPAAAWEESLVDAAGPLAPELGVLGRACGFSPLQPSRRLELHRLIDVLAATGDDGDWIPPVQAVADVLNATMDSVRSWRVGIGDDPLGVELMPWWKQARREAAAGLSALRILQQLRPVMNADGRIVVPDAEGLVHHVFASLFGWAAAREGGAEWGAKAVFGPRFAIHPGLVQLPNGATALDIPLALHENENATDRLVHLALGAYQRWYSTLTEIPADLLVTIDGTVELPDDAKFVSISFGIVGTRQRGPDFAAPFSDSRFDA
jgi:hypothetical protein